MKLGDMRAARVYTLRKRGNLLLCSLLLGNVASYSIMAIYLGSLTSGLLAGIVATSLIFIFGEILPQAVFPRFALRIGSTLYLLVWGTVILFYPLAAPVAWVLDKMLGDEPPVLWSKKELGAIIEYHEHYGNGIIDQDEKQIMLGALSFSDKNVVYSMIPKEQVYFLDASVLMTKDRLEEIKQRGFSRIPVYDQEENGISGVLYSMDLIGLEEVETYSADDLCDKQNVIVVTESMKLDTLLKILVTRKIHMAIVENSNGAFSGVVTLEDIFEEILKTELEDRKF